MHQDFNHLVNKAEHKDAKVKAEEPRRSYVRFMEETAMPPLGCVQINSMAGLRRL